MLHPRAANYSRRALYYFESAGTYCHRVSNNICRLSGNDADGQQCASYPGGFAADVPLPGDSDHGGAVFRIRKAAGTIPALYRDGGNGALRTVDIKEMDNTRLLGVSGSIVLIALAVLVIRYGHVRYPYLEDLEDLEASEDVKHRD